MTPKMTAKEMVEFMKSKGINTDADIIDVGEAVSNYLMMYGFTEDYDVTEDGAKCEAILDYIGNLSESVQKFK